ncbi:MAG: YgfZ/GcvT domain-containing protein [Gammaproteobacteria bacterium]
MSSIPRLAALNRTAVLIVSGEDATDFLHAQLSCDILKLPENSFTFGAWHNPSGKVKALVRLLRTDRGWLLTTSRESAAKTIADLSRFILRDDVTLRDESERCGVYALIGDSSHWLDEEGVELGREPGQSAASGELEWLRIGPELVHALGPHDALRTLATRLPEGDEDSALAAEISLGLPSLPFDMSERFVPQMLNLDLLGALDAGKGCYPGQEVIARTQNLGSVKRRTQRFSSSSDTAPSPGSPVLDDSGEIVGEVLRTATTEDAIEMLAVVRLASLDSPLFLEPESDSPLRRESLPYENRLNLSPQASDEGTG